MTSNTANGGLSGQYPNQGAYEEVVVQTRALPAEVGAGGVSVKVCAPWRTADASSEESLASAIPAYTRYSVAGEAVSDLVVTSPADR